MLGYAERAGKAERGDPREKYVAYCGLYCGSCPISKAEIADLAKELLAKLREWDFDRVARGLASVLEECKPLENYDSSCRVLGTLEGLRCQAICREGGGTPSCQIRTCCQARCLQGCWECPQLERCTLLDTLKPVNGASHLKNLWKIRLEGMESFLEGPKYW